MELDRVLFPALSLTSHGTVGSHYLCVLMSPKENEEDKP